MKLQAATLTLLAIGSFLNTTAQDVKKVESPVEDTVVIDTTKTPEKDAILDLGYTSPNSEAEIKGEKKNHTTESSAPVVAPEQKISKVSPAKKENLDEAQ